MPFITHFLVPIIATLLMDFVLTTVAEELKPEVKTLLDDFVDLLAKNSNNKEEVKKFVGKLFDFADVNKDGYLNFEEYKAFANKILPYIVDAALKKTPSVRQKDARKILEQQSHYLLENLDGIFARLDQDGDRKLNQKEMLANLN